MRTTTTATTTRTRTGAGLQPAPKPTRPFCHGSVKYTRTHLERQRVPQTATKFAVFYLLLCFVCCLRLFVVRCLLYVVGRFFFLFVVFFLPQHINDINQATSVMQWQHQQQESSWQVNRNNVTKESTWHVNPGAVVVAAAVVSCLVLFPPKADRPQVDIIDDRRAPQQ